MPRVEITAARKKNGAPDHGLLVFERQATARAEILAIGQGTTAVGAKLNEAVSCSHFPRRCRKQRDCDGCNFLSISTPKICVRSFCPILAFESDVPHEQAVGFHFFQITPLKGANAFFPPPTPFDRKKKRALFSPPSP